LSSLSWPLTYERLAIDSRKLTGVSADINWNEDSASPSFAGLLGVDGIQGNSSKCSLILMMLVLRFITVWSAYISSIEIILRNSRLWCANKKSCRLTLFYGILGCVRIWFWKIVASVWSCTVKMQAAGSCEALVLNLSTYKILHQKTL
jgi:hypothetical protein